MSVKKTNELLGITDEIINFINEDSFLRSEEKNLSILQNTKTNLSDRKYVVSVIAAMKAGKSTTFNALIGRDLLPNENEPCTTAITEIKHSNKRSEYIEKIYNDGSVEKITAQNGKTLEEQFHEDVRSSRKDNGVSNIKKYYVETPIKSIEGSSYRELVQNFILVDTPGSNEASTGDFDVSILQKIALEQLRNSDALIMLLDYQNYKSDVNARILKDIFENREDLSKDQEKVYFLVNKIDAMTSKDGTVEQVVENVKKLIRQYTPIIKEPKVFPLSAKQACLARTVITGNATEEMKEEMTNNYGSEYRMKQTINGKEYTIIPNPEDFAEPLLEKSKITIIEKHIIENMFNRASEKMIEGAFERLERTINNVGISADSQIEIVSKESNQLYKIVDESKRNIKKLRMEGESILQIPKENLSVLRGQVNSIISQIPDNVKKILSQSMPNENTIQSEDRNFLDERIDIIQSNANNSIEITLNREIDRIQRLAIDSQAKINQELNNAFYQLSDKANEVIGKKMSINFQIFNMDDFTAFNITNVNTDIYDKTENDEVGRTKEFDGKGASLGVAAGASAGGYAGAAIGSVVPVIGTAIGGAIGAGIGAVAGFFLGGSKENIKYEKRKIYTADLKPLKDQLMANSEQMTMATIQNLEKTIDNLVNQYVQFIEKQLNAFISNLDEQLDKIVKEFENNKNSKEEHIKHMDNLKQKVEEFLNRIESLKCN